MSRWVSLTWKEDAMNKNRKKSDVGPRGVALKQLCWAKNVPIEIQEIIRELSFIGDEGCGNRFRPHQVSVNSEQNPRDNFRQREEARQLGIELELPEYPSDIWKHNSHLMKRVMGVSPDGYSYVPTIYENGLSVYRDLFRQRNHPHAAGSPIANRRFARGDLCWEHCSREKHQLTNNTVPRKDNTMSEHIKTVKVKRGLKGSLVKQMKKWDYLKWFINNTGPFWDGPFLNHGYPLSTWNVRNFHTRGNEKPDWNEEWDMDS